MIRLTGAGGELVFVCPERVIAVVSGVDGSNVYVYGKRNHFCVRETAAEVIDMIELDWAERSEP